LYVYSMVVCPIIIVIMVDYLSSFLDHFRGFMWVLRSPCSWSLFFLSSYGEPFKEVHSSSSYIDHRPGAFTPYWDNGQRFNCFLYVIFSRAARWTPCR
jgi:hypothetical protein